MSKKYLRDCCTDRMCKVASFKPPCCIEKENGHKLRCHYKCPPNNPFCHDTLCCECHNTIIYRVLTSNIGIKSKEFVCGGCGYRVCYKCLIDDKFALNKI